MQLVKTWKPAKAAIAAILIFSFFSCNETGQKNVLSPETDLVFQQELAKGGKKNDSACDSLTVANSDLLLVRKREKEDDGVTSMVIGPAGGTLVHSSHRVVIPPGALKDEVTITFEIPVSDTLMFELGPDGIKFHKPIQLILNYDHTCKDDLNQDLFGAAYWNPNANIWQNVPSKVDTELNNVDAQTIHFSRYALTKS